MEKVKILIADDHPLMRNGIKARISNEPDYSLVGEAGNGVEVIEKVLQLKPDIVIMDIVMPRMDGILATEQIKKSSPQTKVIILSMYKQAEYAYRAFHAGAEGYMLKENISDELIKAISYVREGKRYICPIIAEYFAEEYIQHSIINSSDPFYSLSLREKEVLRLIVEGKTNRKIAENLFISISTVKSHRHSIMKKLGVHDIASLTKLAVEKGFITSTE